MAPPRSWHGLTAGWMLRLHAGWSRRILLRSQACMGRRACRRSRTTWHHRVLLSPHMLRHRRPFRSIGCSNSSTGSSLAGQKRQTSAANSMLRACTIEIALRVPRTSDDSVHHKCRLPRRPTRLQATHSQEVGRPRGMQQSCGSLRRRPLAIHKTKGHFCTKLGRLVHNIGHCTKRRKGELLGWTQWVVLNQLACLLRNFAVRLASATTQRPFQCRHRL